jgi:hypothetical protein
MAEIYNSINPNKIKIDYTTQGFPNTFHYDSNYLNINTWYFGIDVNRPYGPSSGTGWYQGVDARTIDDETFTIYYTGTTVGKTNNLNDKYRCVQYDNQSDVINFVNNITNGFPTFGTLSGALNWFKDDGYTRGGGGETVCVNMNYPNIPTSGLTFALDAGHVASYPRMNPTWFDFTQSAMSGFSGNSSIIQTGFDNSLFFNFTTSGTPFQFFVNQTYNRSIGRDMTILFWVQPVYRPADRPRIVFSCLTPNGVQSVGFYDGVTNNDVRLYYEITDTSGGLKSRTGVDTLDLKTWSQVAFVFQANGTDTDISLYINNNSPETNTEGYIAESWQPSSPNWTIGQYADPSKTIAGNYYGGLQVLLVYNRVLSATEIADIYQNYFDTRALFQ